MKVVGTYAADRTTFDRNDLDGNCVDATHVATYVTVGAFRLFTLSSGELRGDVAIPSGPELGGGTRSTEQSLNEAGNEAACSQATGADVEPPEGCSTSLQLVLGPIVASDEPVPPAEQRRSVLAASVMGVGALVTGAATVAYLVNDGTYKNLRDRCSSAAGCSTTTYDDQSDTIHAWDRLSIGGWVVGGAMLVGGGIWWLSSGTASAPTQPRFGAMVDPARARIGVGGDF